MKAYKKQISTAQTQQVAAQQKQQPAPEIKPMSSSQETRVKFMQNIVRNARVNA